MFDTGDMAPDIAGNALHGAHSRDHIAPGRVNTPATANSCDSANTADTEHPNTVRSRGYMSVLERRRCLTEGNPKVQLPTEMLSSNCPPLKLKGAD
jgi:hypothetical protein